MTRVDVLKKARSLISDPANWIQNAEAADASGELVFATSPEASKFCLIGAIRASINGAPLMPGDQDWDVYCDAIDSLYEHTDNRSIASFNDSPETTHDHVLSVLDRAISVQYPAVDHVQVCDA